MGIDISNKLRLKEGMIKPNEDVFVIGKYNNRNTKNDETIEIKPEEEIYISDKSTKQSISYLKRKSITYFILGISIILLISHNIISEFGLL